MVMAGVSGDRCMMQPMAWTMAADGSDECVEAHTAWSADGAGRDRADANAVLEELASYRPPRSRDFIEGPVDLPERRHRCRNSPPEFRQPPRHGAIHASYRPRQRSDDEASAS
jgi:hypothetical protein